MKYNKNYGIIGTFEELQELLDEQAEAWFRAGTDVTVDEIRADLKHAFEDYGYYVFDVDDTETYISFSDAAREIYDRLILERILKNEI